jgi:hypothetical protein
MAGAAGIRELELGVLGCTAVHKPLAHRRPDRVVTEQSNIAGEMTMAADWPPRRISG